MFVFYIKLYQLLGTFFIAEWQLRAILQLTSQI